MPSAADLADRLVAELADPLGVARLPVEPGGPGEHADLVASGVADLTGPADGPLLPVPGCPASAARAALAVAAAYADTALPGVEVLGERAAIAGLRRNAPWSAGGAFRALRAKDGWLGLSLSRSADRDLMPALTGTDESVDCWTAAAKWLADRSLADAVARTELLGLPAAAVPTAPLGERRPPVLVTPGGPRRGRSKHPVVVDLTALWAGPLCARLLGLAGAAVIKVEDVARPDGARYGTPAFFDLMHAGHDFVAIDFGRDADRLVELVASADVVLEASRPRALRQLGLDAAEYVRTGTIWVSITAYGRGVGDELRVGFGDDVAAGAGLVTWLDHVPVPVGDAIADPLAGVHAAAAAIVALHAGQGSLVDVSMHDTARRAASSA